MALAYLCSQLNASEFLPGLQVKPFIVNHQARPESTDEAHMVAKWLSDFGMVSSTVLLVFLPLPFSPYVFQSAADTN